MSLRSAARQYADSLTLAELHLLRERQRQQATGVVVNTPDVYGELGPVQCVDDCEKQVICLEDKTLGLDESKECAAFQKTFVSHLSLRDRLQAQLAIDFQSTPVVEVGLSEAVVFEKKETREIATTVKYRRSDWDQLFGVPAAKTKLSPDVAGFIALILLDVSNVTPIIDMEQSVKTFVEQQAQAVMADPAFAGLREYFYKDIAAPVVKVVEDLKLLQTLNAFFTFPNPFLTEKLISHGWKKILALVRVYTPDADPAKKQVFMFKLLAALYISMEARDAKMFQFFRLWWNRATPDGDFLTELKKPQYAARLYLMFLTAANIYYTTDDKQYLRGFWALGVPEWTDWNTSINSARATHFPMGQLIRIQRLYVTANAMEDTLNEPPEEVQAAKLTSASEFLKERQKDSLYTVV